MGYTHYFQSKRTYTQKEWNAFKNECKEIHDKMRGVKIGGADDGYGEGSPEFNTKVVAFNGKDDDSHEPFVISNGNNKWAFCKTARKPYDRLVCACLISANKHLGYKFKSDGIGDSYFDSEWDAGIRLYNRVTNSNLGRKDIRAMAY
jgi:hypothetical protein